MDEINIIPLVQLKDGNMGYDCDIFGGDNVKFLDIGELRISGNISVGDNFECFDLYVGESGFFGDNADTLCIETGGDAFFGDFASVYSIASEGRVVFGCNALTGNVVSNDSTFFQSEHKIVF